MAPFAVNVNLYLMRGHLCRRGMLYPCKGANLAIMYLPPNLMCFCIWHGIIQERTFYM